MRQGGRHGPNPTPIVGSTGTRRRSSPSSRNTRRTLLRAAIRAEVGRVEGLVVGPRQPDPTHGAVIVEWAIERSRRNFDLSHASSDAHRSAIIGGGPLRADARDVRRGRWESALLRPCQARSSRERGRYVPQCSSSAIRATRQPRHETVSIRDNGQATAVAPRSARRPSRARRPAAQAEAQTRVARLTRRDYASD